MHHFHDVLGGQVRILDLHHLVTALVDHLSVGRQEAVLHDVVVKFRARDKREPPIPGWFRRQVPWRSLMVLVMVSRVSPGSPRDEIAVDHQAKLVAILGELPRAFHGRTLLDVLAESADRPIRSRRSAGGSRLPSSPSASRKSVVTREVQDHVRPSGFSLAQSSTVRTFWMLKVSSSKKNSFDVGPIPGAFAPFMGHVVGGALCASDARQWSAATSRTVHCAGHPRVVEDET